MRSILLCLLAAVTATCCARATPSPAQGQGSFSVATRSVVLSRIQTALHTYFFAHRIPALQQTLDSHRTTLLQINDPQAFATQVTKYLYSVAHDKHLVLFYSTTTIPIQANGKPTARDLAYIRHDEALNDFGVATAMRMWGNVGYLRLNYFATMPEAKPAIDSAMDLLSHTDALIIDLRGNQGGNPSSIDYFMGYLFPKPTQLTSILWRSNGKTSVLRRFSAKTVSGPRYLSRPIYVLTDNRTISAGEDFAYDLKAVHRAMLIGQTTAGGANPGVPFRLTTHFDIFVPQGQARNPFTGTNWEGVGVAPDLSVAPADALLKAYVLALSAIHDPFDDAVQERNAALKDPRSAMLKSVPEINDVSGGDVR
jgi:retinol-binding protein 3